MIDLGLVSSGLTVFDYLSFKGQATQRLTAETQKKSKENGGKLDIQYVTGFDASAEWVKVFAQLYRKHIAKGEPGNSSDLDAALFELNSMSVANKDKIKDALVIADYLLYYSKAKKRLLDQNPSNTQLKGLIETQGLSPLAIGLVDPIGKILHPEELAMIAKMVKEKLTDNKSDRDLEQVLRGITQPAPQLDPNQAERDKLQKQLADLRQEKSRVSHTLSEVQERIRLLDLQIADTDAKIRAIPIQMPAERVDAEVPPADVNPAPVIIQGNASNGGYGQLPPQYSHPAQADLPPAAAPSVPADGQNPPTGGELFGAGGSPSGNPVVAMGPAVIPPPPPAVAPPKRIIDKAEFVKKFTYPMTWKKLVEKGYLSSTGEVLPKFQGNVDDVFDLSNSDSELNKSDYRKQIAAYLSGTQISDGGDGARANQNGTSQTVNMDDILTLSIGKLPDTDKTVKMEVKIDRSDSGAQVSNKELKQAQTETVIKQMYDKSKKINFSGLLGKLLNKKGAMIVLHLYVDSEAPHVLDVKLDEFQKVDKSKLEKLVSKLAALKIQIAGLPDVVFAGSGIIVKQAFSFRYILTTQD